MGEASKELSLLSFNVEGLESILRDPSFHTLIDVHDICFLSETMKRDDSKLNLKGFWDFSLVRKKNKKAGRFSGGITVLVKEHLRGGVKIAHTSEGFLWLRLCKTFFNFQKDQYICGAYIPPYNSSKEILVKTNYYHDLLSMTNHFLGLGEVLLVGDFNARVGIVEIPSDVHIPVMESIMPTNCSPCELPQRSSCDRTVNQYGKKV